MPLLVVPAGCPLIGSHTRDLEREDEMCGLTDPHEALPDRQWQPTIWQWQTTFQREEHGGGGGGGQLTCQLCIKEQLAYTAPMRYRARLKRGCLYANDMSQIATAT